MTDALVTLRTGQHLSPMQRGLWASQRRHPESPLQNMALLSHLDGVIDTQRLADAFDLVVRATDVLRSTIVSENGQDTMQLLADPIPSEFLDLDRADVERWADERAALPINMRRCGYDSVIITHGDGTTSWYLALHHVITDATASAAVFQRTAAAYFGEAPPKHSYYAWAKRLASPEAGGRAEKRRAKALAHWTGRQAPAKVGQLYRPRRGSTPKSVRYPVALDPSVAEQAAARLSTDYVMLSDDLAWTTLLATTTALLVHRISGADKMALGLPVHNRSDAETREVIGPVMEVFPVDVSVEADDTYRILHQRVGRAIMTTLRHAAIGTAPAVEVDAIINVIARAGLGSFGPIPATTRWMHAGAADPSHLLRLQYTSYDADQSELALDLNAAGADAAHGERAATHLHALLADIVADPDRPIGELALPNGAEADAIHAWGNQPACMSDATPIHQAIEQSLRGNHGPCLEDGDRDWIGPELWEWVARFATKLRADGVGPGVRVGIEIDRSAEAIVAMYATLLAGGSYVPLDPAQPRDRLDRLARRANCIQVLRSVPAVDELPFADLGAVTYSSDDEAYLLFTSGSTGEPKGVPISRGALAEYVRFARRSYVPCGSVPIAPLFSALTFDLTVTTVFVPILAGGRVVIVRPDGPAGLRQIADRPDITWAKATPSHLELLVRQLPEGHQLASLVVGGEAFPGALAKRLWRSLPQLRIFNEYGPTEAVVGCMIHEAEADELDREVDVPIGRPAPGVQLRILDAYLRPVPVGAAGELYIAHAGLTAGYLRGSDGSPAVSPDPFVHIDGVRFYRSGDLVRMIDDHTATYLGRADEQIKVGGIRLEPSEVEAALVAHPAISRAAVRVWSPSASAASMHCVRCGLPSNVPGVEFDAEGVCATCHSYARIKGQAEAYFRSPDDLIVERDRARARRSGRYDVLHLLSGGKDSTYALYQLVELGYDVYSITLDNGFIAEGAKENVRRSVADLGIDHEFVTSDVMNEVFRDSLDRFSNVCNGCYKTIYTLATTKAVELGIPLIVTGLSRGQLFETRLIPQQFSAERFDVEAIDRAVVEARKAYHRADDPTNRLLDTSVFDDEAVFDAISYLDFYRYVDVELSEMLAYLDSSAPWVRPADTGRSTNCLINDAGIHNHVLEQGYHNYAVPYAWDVRLGHKTRDEAIDELADELDLDRIMSMLGEVGYESQPREVLTSWIELAPLADEPSPAELRTFLGGRLPSYAIPSAFVTVDAVPMTSNGKLDTAALPSPTRVHRQGPALYVSPESPTESAIVAAWERVLRIEPISVTDDFFELGGDSLAALEMVMVLGEELSVTVREELAFTHTTPRELAAAIVGQGDTADAPLGAGPTRRPDGTPPPLSAGESAMLFEYFDQPANPMYNVGRRYTLPTTVDVARLETAILAAVDRHTPLHWTYATPRRRLDAIAAIDIAMQGEQIGAAEFAESAHAAYLRPFDLEAGPLGRAVFQPLDEGRVGLLLAFHHVSVDAGSFDRLWDDIDALYQGDQPGPLAVDYADHASWQAAQPSDAARTYWSSPSIAVPVADVDLGSSSYASSDGYCEQRSELSADELRTGPGQTPFATALGALVATLRTRADGDRIGVGITGSARDHPLAEPLVGYYLNTLPLVVGAEPEATLAEVCGAASTAIGQALTHRSYPFAQIVADRRAADLPSPSVSVMLAFEDLAPAHLDGSEVGHRILASGSAVTDATFFVQVRGQRVDVGLEYRGSVLRAEAAADLLADFAATLVACVQRRNETVAALSGAPLVRGVRGGATAGSDADLSDVDRELVLRDFNATTVPIEVATLPEQIAQRALAQPDHPAVRSNGHTLTYGDLDRRANQLANNLRSRGVVPNSFVGVYADRRPEMVVAILGILRSGAAFVPIDADYPDERIAHIVRDAGLEVIVTAGPSGRGVAVTAEHLDLLDFDFEAHDAALPPAPSADDLAYVIYTSGSTGLPKGVLVEHGNIASSTAVRGFVYDAPVDRFLLLSSFAFDSSMVGIFWTLSQGATLVLPNEGQHQDVLHLDALIETEGVSHLLALPSLYQLMLDEAEPGQLDALTTVIVAGEACPGPLVGLHNRQLSNASLHNEYGPTEGTVWSHAYRFPTDFDPADPVPIGAAIPNVTSFVVDEHFRPVALGVPGELVIGGPGIARGYLNRDDLTAERFVPYPEAFRTHLATAVDDDERLYRTGDLVRWQPDGTLLFLGRIDHQVKIRGHRVELGEIESAIANQGEVDEVVVDVRDIPIGGTGIGGQGRTAPRLTAWFTGPADTDALRRHLRERLPEYMVPTFMVPMVQMPRTANGKVDRDGLPAPERPIATAQNADGEASAIEIAIAAMWAETLGLDAVDRHDNFFDLGGDSIISMQIVAKLRRAGVKLSPRQVFEHQTVAELAMVAEGSTASTAEQGRVSGAVALSPIQEWFFDQDFAEPNHWNQSLWLSMADDVDLDVLRRAAQVLPQHHDALRTVFVGRAAEILDTEVAVPVEVFAPDVDPAAAARSLEAGFDLASGPLLRIGVFPGTERTKVFVTAHHLIVDGVSWAPLLDDWATAYAQLSAGEPVTLPPKSTSWKRWVGSLSAFADSATYVTDVERFAASPPLQGMDLPVGATEAEAGVVAGSLTDGETSALLGVATARHRSSVEEIVLAAAAASFTEHFEWPALAVLLEGHGREDVVDAAADVSRTVGWFTTQYPLTIDVDDPNDLAAAVSATKAARRAVPNQGVAYLLGRSTLGGSVLAGRPDPRIVFNYLGQLDRSLAMPDLFALEGPLRGGIGAQNRRPHAVGIMAFVQDGVLTLQLDYATSLLTDADAEALLGATLRTLRSLLADDAGGAELGAADFDLLDFDDDEFANLRNLLD